MKAILFVALFVFACQAVQFNFPAYHQGFLDQINFNGSQLIDTINCGVSVQKTIADFKKVQAAENEGIEQVLYAVFNLVAEIQANLRVECVAYAKDVAQYFTQMNTTTEIKKTIHENWEKYAPYIIQQVAVWNQQHFDQLDYEAGKTEAYLLQIILGVETPDVLPMPQVNTSDIVPFNADKFYKEYYNGFLTTLGLTNEADIETIGRCGEYFTNATTALLTFEKDFKNLTDLHDKIVLIRKTSQIVMMAADSCTASWAIEKPYFVKAWENFKFLPLLSAIQFVYNVAVNLPEIQQQQMQLVVDVLEGKYQDAGVIEGNIQLTMFKNVTYF